MQADTCIIVLMTGTPLADRVFKALADPTRRELLDALRVENGQTLTALCARMSMARQSVTQHIDLLVAADLVVVVRQGRERRHYLNASPIHDIERRWIREFDRPILETLHTIRTHAEETPMTQLTVPSGEPLPDGVFATYINATAQQVWDALTDPTATATYWNGMANTSDWTTGSTWLHLKPNGDHDIWGIVVLSEPPHRLVFTFQPASQPLDHPGSKVTCILDEADGVTRLTITHTNLPDAGTLQGISRGWPTVLASLKSYLETGQPLPDTVWQLMQA